MLPLAKLSNKKHLYQGLLHRRIILFCISLNVLLGCSHKLSTLDIEASLHGFSREITQGKDFQHVIYKRDATDNDSTLHVYLDGDGQPWVDNHQVSADPTPVNPIMLKLMAMDRTAAIYLGRPCYHGLATLPACNPALWTSARYSLAVVDSMQQVLTNYIKLDGYSELVLIGHSGGATLAMLLAERINATRAVVTVAGNLDTDAWSEYHRYSPLKDSLNPALQPLLNPGKQQYHLIGKTDKNIPYHIVKNFLNKQSNARILHYENFDHDCCWDTIWPDFLSTLKKDIE